MPSSFLVDPLIICCVVAAQDDLVSIDEGRGRSCSRSTKRCDVDPACLGLIALLLRRVPALRLSSSHDDRTIVLCYVTEHECWMCRESGFSMEHVADIKSVGKHNFCGCGAYVELGGRPRALRNAPLVTPLSQYPVACPCVGGGLWTPPKLHVGPTTMKTVLLCTFDVSRSMGKPLSRHIQPSCSMT